MIIKISNLNEGNHEFDFEEPVEKIGLNKPFLGNIVLKVNLSKVQHQVIVDAGLEVNADLTCDRCGKPYNKILKNNYKVAYLFSNDDIKSDDLDTVYLPIDTDKIKLDNDARDYAMLSIPMKSLCKEDCKGLCFKCGKDLNEVKCGCPDTNIDVRWKPLQELKNKLNTN